MVVENDLAVTASQPGVRLSNFDIIVATLFYSFGAVSILSRELRIFVGFQCIAKSQRVMSLYGTIIIATTNQIFRIVVCNYLTVPNSADHAACVILDRPVVKRFIRRI